MKLPNVILIATGIIASLTCTAQAAWSTIGLAEWQVYTPGGNLILHVDGWKYNYGDCLKADDEDPTIPPEERGKVYVARLKRWQYYKGYVAGETQIGFFLFHEVSKQVAYYANEKALRAAIDRLGLGQSTSGWLSGGDGWIEAWYPVMVWQPCQELLSQPDARTPAPGVRPLSQEECRQAISKETLRRYRETTWGRVCQKFKAAPPEEQQHRQDLHHFCDAILEVR